jgi:alpha-amylase
VLLAHWNQYKTDIFNMVAARRAVRLHSESQVTVNQYSGNLYVSTANGMNGTLIVKIGSGSYTPPSGYTLVASGTDYAMWIHTIAAAAPLLMAVPSGGTYYTAQTITATASPGASIYYTTNNTPPNNNSTLYTGPIPVATTQTVRLIAYNPTTLLYSQEIANTYTIVTMPTSIRVRFKVPVGWTACKVYSWVGTTPLCGPWPGTSMTLGTDGYYSYNIAGFNNLPIGVVFNNGTGSQQTVDLFTATDKCWDAGPLQGGKYTAIEVACPTVGTDEMASSGWSIFPNPAHDFVQFSLPDGYRFVSLLSSSGMTQGIAPGYNGNNGRIDLTGLASGVYFITLTKGTGERLTRSFVKY